MNYANEEKSANSIYMYCVFIQIDIGLIEYLFSETEHTNPSFPITRPIRV